MYQASLVGRLPQTQLFTLWPVSVFSFSLQCVVAAVMVKLIQFILTTSMAFIKQHWSERTTVVVHWISVLLQLVTWVRTKY